MTDADVDSIVDEASQIEAEVKFVCQGKRAAAVYTVLSRLLGEFAAQAGNPDFDGFMKIVRTTAKAGFDQAQHQGPLQ